MITLSLLHPLNKKPVQHWTFEEDSVIRIGRSTENQVVLYSAVVSRHHVELRQTDAGWEIVNLGTNGTYLDGKRVAQAIAEDGMVIRLARSGPNIQINISQEAPDSMKALRQLQSNAESRTKVEFNDTHSADAHPTRIDPDHKTTSETSPSVQS
ncbi:FHA domain-containing protein [Leptolyngbya iicbica]|uniref:FHA domain-containing protein n=2 Tax=Cyanophyceae TaxID=3028117 RepID=A0A4Q7E3B3_9CYAN|nr:FHA domain-containing protein [Leptolyngbya sp. LK]RZM76113.1 FHA domain-containing protein [Leptolyngbya sp. LK]